MLDQSMETEFIKRRLGQLDGDYNKFIKAFNTLVEKFKNLKQSPLAFFNQYDNNQDGLLNQTEFSEILRVLQIPVAQEDLGMIFKYMDADGSGQLEYKEFMKKLRRAGVRIKGEQEQIIHELYEQIEKIGMSLKDAYDMFDRNNDNAITAQEMMDGFQALKIQVTQETINYIFKMADISGDGMITFDEWRGLFENFLRDLMSRQDLSENYDLDWKKAVMLKIEEGLHEKGCKLIDLYKFMDLEKDQQISIIEFKDLFYKVGIEWDIVKITTLFKDIDQDDSKYVDYNELLHYIKEAKRENERLERQRQIRDRSERLNAQNKDQIVQPMDQTVGQSIEARLMLKLATLEQREKNLNDRNKLLRKQLNKTDKTNAQLQIKCDELEIAIVKANEYFHREKQRVIEMEQQQAGSLTGNEAQILRTQNDKLQIENNELKSALQTFQNLYSVAYEQTIVTQMSKTKKEHEMEILQQTVRELESQSDDKSLYGKLKHLLMISRWQEGEIKKKYESINVELQDLKIKYESEKALNQRFEKENDSLYGEYREKVQKAEIEISDLK